MIVDHVQYLQQKYEVYKIKEQNIHQIYIM